MKGKAGKKRRKLGVSGCLLGEPVRYDSGHKRDRYLTDILARYVEYVPVCPEVECGLSLPREPMCLSGDPMAPHLVECKTGLDHTERMQDWGKMRLAQLAQEQLCGFIFKCGSPSCGLGPIKAHGKGGRGAGVGIWARMVMEHFPQLPCEEEEGLLDPARREKFLAGTKGALSLWTPRWGK